MSVSTDEEIKDFMVDVLLDGEDPGDGIYDLLTLAKDLIESEMELEITKVIDTSNSTTGNESYTTNPISLPSDFLTPRTRRALWVNELELFQVPIEQRELYKYDQSKFYIDYANNELYFLGEQVSGQMVTLAYNKFTPDIDGDGTNCVWPVKFRKLIAYTASIMELEGIDADDINLSLALGQSKIAGRLWKAMQYWDHKLKVAAMGGRAGARQQPSRARHPNHFQP